MSWNLFFSALIEDICRNSSPQVYKLAAYLVAYHRSFTNILQERIVKNAKKLELEVLLEVFDRIQMIDVIDGRILERMRKLYLNDITELLKEEQHGVWFRKKYRRWIEKIVTQLGKTCSLVYIWIITVSYTHLTLPTIYSV